MAIKSGVSVRNVLVLLAVITLITGGILSLFVSSRPDGLEWSIEKIVGMKEPEIDNSAMERAASIQGKTAFMPEYNFKDAGEESFGAGPAIAGIAGGVITFILAGISVLIISLVKKKRNEKQNTCALRT